MPVGAAWLVAAAALLATIPAARAQDIRIDSTTRFVMPAAVAGCAAPAITAGAGLVTAELACGDGRRLFLTVASGGSHLRSPAERLARAALAWRPGAPPSAERLVLPTMAAPIAMRCITMPISARGVEVTCVRDESLTRLELVAEAPDGAGALGLIAATLEASALVAPH